MENNELVNKLGKLEKEIRNLRKQLLNENINSKPKGKGGKTIIYSRDPVEDKYFSNDGELEKEFKIKQLLLCFELPTDEQFIEDVLRVATKKDLTIEQIQELLKRCKQANDKNPKDNIEKYILGSLHKESQNNHFRC